MTFRACERQNGWYWVLCHCVVGSRSEMFVAVDLLTDIVGPHGFPFWRNGTHRELEGTLFKEQYHKGYVDSLTDIVGSHAYLLGV